MSVLIRSVTHVDFDDYIDAFTVENDRDDIIVLTYQGPSASDSPVRMTMSRVEAQTLVDAIAATLRE